MEDGILIKDIVKNHIKKENELENKINELNEELKKAKNNSEDTDYFLYKDILKLIIPYMQFEYRLSYETQESGYIIKMETPLIPFYLINEIFKDIEKYKKDNNIL